MSSDVESNKGTQDSPKEKARSGKGNILSRYASGALFWLTSFKTNWRKLLASKDAGFWLFFSLAFCGSMVWAKSRDPFERVWFKLKAPDYGKMEAVAVLPKPVRTVPIVLYVYGSGGSLINSGNVLRQLAELGVASVVLEYNQTNTAAFNQQFTALLDWIPKQSWVDTDRIAWLGTSRGAQQTLSFLLEHPEREPDLYVRIGGGILPELEGDNAAFRPHRLKNVLLVHGENDSVFPVSDVHKLAEFFDKRGVATEKKIILGKGHMFESDRGLVTRNIGEYMKAWMTPYDPKPRFPITKDYWFVLCILPAFLWAGSWFYLRRQQNPRESLPDCPPTRFEKILRWAAIILGTAAVIQTGIHLGTPRLQVSERTLSIARRHLIPPKWSEDFEETASKEYWRGHKLKTLLTHVELSNYCVYELINWKLDKDIYKQFVLSPIIDSENDPELNWRRPLWEFFYPRIRKENDTQSAAEIVVRNLRERVTIDPRSPYATEIESIWRNQITTPEGFERIYVATLRSVGVPARLDGEKKAEFWTGSEWKTAPRPLIETWLE